MTDNEKGRTNTPCVNRQCVSPTVHKTTESSTLEAPHLSDGDPQNPLLAAAYRFVAIANTLTDETETLSAFIDAIKEVSGCNTVGIRIYDEQTCLVYGTPAGFSNAFMVLEKEISVKNPCLCSRVFLRQTDEALPCFSTGGSFYTNNAKELMSSPMGKGLVPLEGTCFTQRYQSIGLFPIRSRDTILGLIHVADPRLNQIPPDQVELVENAALQLGVSIERHRAMVSLEQSRINLETRVNQRTAELDKTIQALNEQVTQRHSAERHLHQNQFLFQRVFEAISDPLILMDEKAHVTMVNPAAQKYYGVEMIEKAILHICFEGLGRFRNPCQSCRIPAAVAQGRRMEFEREGFRDGQRTETVELFPVKDDSGRPKGALMRVHDITEAKATEQQVAAIQNQASMGMLVSSVAHEIKNPNSFIAFNISVLQEYFNDLLPVLDKHAATHEEFKVARLPYTEFRTDVFKLMETIARGSKRIDAFLGNLREMGSEKPTVRCRRLSLADVVDKVLDTVKGKIERIVEHVEVRIDPHLNDVYSDSGILEQVLVNLLVNAAQAADKADAYIHLNAGQHPTDPQRVIIKVEDNGHGMDEQTRNRIFEPFYSTKIADGGTGLGLYVCRNLLNHVGGKLRVDSALGEGTCFTIDLPTHDVIDRMSSQE